jgi:hypothetical protein
MGVLPYLCYPFDVAYAYLFSLGSRWHIRKRKKEKGVILIP